MYIQPNAKLILLSGSPCDADYTNTLWWDKTDTGKQAQYNYFYGLRKSGMIFNDFSTIRVNGGSIRVPVNSERLYDVNYLMFQNTHFDGKWFFAFVTAVNYINNDVSEIEFDIDVIQTWYFDYDFNECFVSRQHASNDSVGANIVNENVGISEIVMNNYHRLQEGVDLQGLAVILAIMETVTYDEETDVGGKVYDRVYGATTLYKSDVSLGSLAIRYLNSKIEEDKIHNYENIIGLYTVPREVVFEKNNQDARCIPITNHTDGRQFTFSLNVDVLTSKTSGGLYFPKYGSTLNGYEPKNNKLFTYPYNYLQIDNGHGDSLALRYEFFKDQIPSVEIDTCMTEPVQVVLRPVGYKGVRGIGNNPQSLNTESLMLQDYPQCSVATDYFKAWISQNKVSLGLSALGTAINIGASAVSGHLMTGVITSQITDPKQFYMEGSPSVAEEKSMNQRLRQASYQTKQRNIGRTANTVTDVSSSILNTINSVYKASITANNSVGKVGSGNINVACFKQNFFIGRCSVDYQTARVIDNFFTIYGYATNRVKVPNTHARGRWTYLKTVGCTIKGKMPTDDEKTICAIHDKGITYWTSGEEVGNYSLLNIPLYNEEDDVNPTTENLEIEQEV